MLHLVFKDIIIKVIKYYISPTHMSHQQSLFSLLETISLFAFHLKDHPEILGSNHETLTH